MFGAHTPVSGMWLISTTLDEGRIGEVEKDVEESEVGWKDGEKEEVWNGESDGDGQIDEDSDECWRTIELIGMIGIIGIIGIKSEEEEEEEEAAFVGIEGAIVVDVDDNSKEDEGMINDELDEGRGRGKGIGEGKVISITHCTVIKNFTIADARISSNPLSTVVIAFNINCGKVLK